MNYLCTGFKNNPNAKTQVNMIYFYITGVIITLIALTIYLSKQGKIYLTDTIGIIIYSALSWTTVVFIIWNLIEQALEKRNLNPIIFEKKNKISKTNEV